MSTLQVNCGTSGRFTRSKGQLVQRRCPRRHPPVRILRERLAEDRLNKRADRGLQKRPRNRSSPQSLWHCAALQGRCNARHEHEPFVGADCHKKPALRSKRVRREGFCAIDPYARPGFLLELLTGPGTAVTRARAGLFPKSSLDMRLENGWLHWREEG
jgi:hypothetical protein